MLKKYSTRKILPPLALGVCFLSSTSFAGGIGVMPTEEPHWNFYFGGFGGIYYAYLHADTSTVFNSVGGGLNSTIERAVIAEKDGYLGGANIGFTREFRKHSFAGVELAVTSGTGEGKTSNNFALPGGTGGVAAVPAFTVNRFSLNYQFDVAALLGMCVTHRSSIYTKVGLSITTLDDKARINVPQNGAGPIVLRAGSLNNEISKDITMAGLLVGFGSKYAISKNVDVFGEYDYYYYCRGKSTNVVNFAGLGGSTATSSGRVTVGTFRFGINYNVAI